MFGVLCLVAVLMVFWYACLWALVEWVLDFRFPMGML